MNRLIHMFVLLPSAVLCIGIGSFMFVAGLVLTSKDENIGWAFAAVGLIIWLTSMQGLISVLMHIKRTKEDE